MTSTHEAQPEAGSAFLSRSQEKAIATLTAMVELGSGQDTYGGFRIRTAPLLHGESGAGKTAVIRQLAERLGAKTKPYPLLQISSPGWVILGAKAEPPTLTVIRSFVRRHDRGIVHLDEIEKAVPSGEAAWSETWCTTLTGEMLSVMDAIASKGADTRLLSAGWTREDISKLSGFTIVGSGAWQRAAQKAEDRGTTHQEAMADEMILPPEITRRFSPKHIEVCLPDKQDFVTALTGLYLALGLPARESMIDVVTDAAVNSGLGFRFIESHLTDLLLRYPKLRRPTHKRTSESTRKTLSAAAYEEARRNTNTLFQDLEPAIASLRLQVRLHSSRFFPESEPFTEKQMTLVEFDQTCLDLMAGLHLRYAVADETRHKLHAMLWRSAHSIGDFVGQRLDRDLKWLADHHLMNLFGTCQLRVARAIASWQYLCSYDPPSEP